MKLIKYMFPFHPYSHFVIVVSIVKIVMIVTIVELPIFGVDRSPAPRRPGQGLALQDPDTF